jgi:hypothetical protein
MILYNITFKVEPESVADFKFFLAESHFPVLDDRKEILRYEFFRLLNQDDSDGLTFTLQHFLPDLGTYNHFIAFIDSKFKQQLWKEFGEKVLYFCTVLEKA